MSITTGQLNIESTRPPLNRTLVETGLVAILRLPDPARLADLVDTLVTVGVRCLELTLTTKGALGLLTDVLARVPATVEVGVGTVTSGPDAEAALGAGAAFLVSPVVQPEVLAAGQKAGVPVYPGALTPTEILAAWRGGASAVKLFPASAVDAGYVAQIRAPLPEVPLVPTGGIRLDNLAGYLRAGCVAVGVGGPLIGDTWRDGDLKQLEARARAYLEAITEARSAGG